MFQSMKRTRLLIELASQGYCPLYSLQYIKDAIPICRRLLMHCTLTA